MARLDQDMGEMGPAMKALTERQRGFVIALLEQGDDNHTKAALAAGYSNAAGPRSTYLRKVGHELFHDQRIQAAIQEEAQRQINGSVGMAVRYLTEIASSPGTGATTRLRAIEMILNRGGIHARTEHSLNVNQRIEVTDHAAIEKIKLLAQQLGMDAKLLLGAAGVDLDTAESNVIEGEFSVVPAGDGTEGLEDIL